MQLVNPQRGTSFYESFSDLIFGTLIIFLVVILALMTRIKSKQNEYVKAAEAEIAINEYAGGSVLTEWGFSFVIREGKPAVAFIPQEVWAKGAVMRFESDNVVLELCTQWLDPRRGVTVLSIKEFQDLSGGFSEAFAQGGVIYPEIGDMISRIFAVQEAEGGSLSAWTPGKLVTEIGGMMAGTFFPSDQPSATALAGSDAYFDFIAGPGEPLPDGDPMQFFRHYETLRRPMARQIGGTADEPARIRFGLNDHDAVAEPTDRLIVGQTRLTPTQFRGILNSMSPGKNFYVEYDGPGGEPTAPPPWVGELVLKPVGFNRPVASADAVRLLEQQRSQAE